MVDPLEVICSVVAGKIFHHIISFLMEKYRSQKHIEEKLQRLRQLLIAIHTALEAAEGRAITNSWMLRWLHDLEDAACQGDRTLRAWRHWAIEASSTLVNSSNTFKRIRIATAQFVSCKEAAIRIAGTVEKLETVAAGIAKFIEFLRLECHQAVVHRPIIIFVSMHNRLIGRIHEKQQAINFLLGPWLHQIFAGNRAVKISAKNRKESFIPYGYVLSIWGRKGVGKTTLAQLVCNDHKVKNHFSMTVWVCCREHPSPEVALVRSLCKKLDCGAYIGMDVSYVIRMVAGRLRSERLLLVLDGISSYTREMNEILRMLLGNSREGSKVIITTIYEQLARRMGHLLPIYFLQMEDLGCLFMENALGGAHPEEHKKLLVIGKEIAETLGRCSPLAAKVLSGVLGDNLNEKYWHSVLSCCRQFTASYYKVTPFMLSCKLLPAHLQRCFVVFGTYRHWIFTREAIVSLWVNNGAVSDINSGKCSMENVAADCFDDLLKKAFIQPSRIPGLFRVDDMLRDIALYMGPMPRPKTRIHRNTNKNRRETSKLIDQNLVQTKL